MNTYYFVADWIENYYTTIKDCLFSIKANTLEEAQDKIIKKYSKKLNIKYKPYNDFVESLDFYKGIRIGKLTTEITDFESIY